MRATCVVVSYSSFNRPCSQCTTGEGGGLLQYSTWYRNCSFKQLLCPFTNHSSECFKFGQRICHSLDFNYRKYHPLYLIMFSLFNELNILIFFFFVVVTLVKELKFPFRKKKKSTSAFNSPCSVFILKIYFAYESAVEREFLTWTYCILSTYDRYLVFVEACLLTVKERKTIFLSGRIIEIWNNFVKEKMHFWLS